MPDTFTVFTRHGAVIVENVPLERAARVADVQEEDLAWCIENTGYCWGSDVWVVPFGDACPRFEERTTRGWA